MREPVTTLQEVALPEVVGMRRASFCKLDRTDLEQLLHLERQCFSHPWTAKQFNLALEQELFNVFGFKHEAALLAYLSFYQTGEEMEIFNLGVSPSLRRQGLGGRLLGLVLQIGRKMGITYAFLEVRESNTPARNLYAGYGFSQVGVRRKYYPDNGEDALVLRLDLQTAPKGGDELNQERS